MMWQALQLKIWQCWNRGGIKLTQFLTRNQDYSKFQKADSLIVLTSSNMITIMLGLLRLVAPSTLR